MSALAVPFQDSIEPGETFESTLLELVEALSEFTQNEEELVAAVIHMLQSGRVQLQGNFRAIHLPID